MAVAEAPAAIRGLEELMKGLAPGLLDVARGWLVEQGVSSVSAVVELGEEAEVALVEALGLSGKLGASVLRKRFAALRV